MTATPSIVHHAVILTALPVEYNAVRSHLASVIEWTHPEGTVYEQGMFFGGGRTWQVTIVETDAGNEGAAMECERAIRAFTPSIVMMVGVAGGIKDVSLYDVVVADKVYGYDAGKVSGKGFAPRPDVAEPSYALVQRARSEAKKNDWQARVSPSPKTPPAVLVGAIAAGNKVIASRRSAEYRSIRSRFGDALAVEMEGRGVLKAGHANQSVKSIVIRGISDLIDDKNQTKPGMSDGAATQQITDEELAARQDAERQRIAARHASAFAFEMLAKLDPTVFVNGGSPVQLPPPSSVNLQSVKLKHLERLYLASRARCIEKWQAAGLTLDQAREFSEDYSIQTHNLPLIQPSQMLLLLGEQGMGKSLTAERALQKAIAYAREDAAAPIPIYLYAPDVDRPLGQAVAAAITGLEDLEDNGLFIVIDAADEAGVNRAEALFKEARVFVQSWPKATLIFTSRPLPLLSRAEEKYDVPLLSAEAAYNLIGRIAGHPVSPYISDKWSQSMREAMRVPLFALFIGVRLRHSGMAPLGSLAELMTGMVEDSLYGTTQNVRQAEDALQDLAHRSLDRGGPVPLSEFSSAVRDVLLSSRLVIERQHALTFALRIHAEWFGTQCLCTGTPAINVLLEDFPRLDRWRYAIIMAAHSLSQQQVAGLLTPLAARHPGFAAQVIEASNSERFQWERSSAACLSAQECGEQIYAAMQAWVKGIGPHAPLFSPVQWDGQVRTIGTRIDGGGLMVSWYKGEDSKPTAVVLPPELALPTAPSKGWPSVNVDVYTQPEALWAWRFTLKDLVQDLKPMLQKRVLLPPPGALRREMMWRIALDMAAQGEYATEPIPLENVEVVLNRVPVGIAFGITPARVYSPALIDLFREEIGQLHGAGKSEMLYPYPVRDLDSSGLIAGFQWEVYSDEQMMALAREVYTAALEGYAQLVETYFPNFASSFRIYSLLPVKMVGMFRPPSRSRQHNMFDRNPWLGRFMDVLPSGSRSRVDVQLGDYEMLKTAAEQSSERLEYHRPTHISSNGITVTSGSTEIFGAQPATHIAYGWLMEDFASVGWTL